MGEQKMKSPKVNISLLAHTDLYKHLWTDKLHRTQTIFSLSVSFYSAVTSTCNLVAHWRSALYAMQMCNKKPFRIDISCLNFHTKPGWKIVHLIANYKIQYFGVYVKGIILNVTIHLMLLQTCLQHLFRSFRLQIDSNNELRRKVVREKKNCKLQIWMEVYVEKP